MTKTRRIVSLSLAVLLTVSLLLVPGTTNAMKKPGRIDGVDYTRIRENRDLLVEVRFTLGTSTFTGELSNGSVLSRDEIDGIVDGVMDQMNITSGVLEYSAMVIEQAKHLKGFDPAAALRIGLNVAGFGTFNDIYDMYTGKKEIGQAAADFVIGQLTGEAVKLITGAKWADLALNAFLSTKDIAAEWTRISEEKEIAEKALQRQLLLDLFYKECNERLKKAEEDRGTNNWKLKVSDIRYGTKKFFGIDVEQIKWLKVDMERVDSFGEKSVTNWSGIYEGSIVIEIWHDLANFDVNFPTIFTENSDIFRRIQHLYKVRPESAKEKSTLTKVITLSDAQIHIDKRNAVGTTLTKSVPLKGAEDVSAFNLAHAVTYSLDFGQWDDGSLVLNSSAATYRSEVTMKEGCSGTLLEGNRYPAIVWDTHDVTAWDSLSAPRGGWDKRELKGNGNTRIGRPAIADYRIFDDLRDNMLTLWIKNIDKAVTVK